MNYKIACLAFILTFLLSLACTNQVKQDAQTFLDEYTETYQKLDYKASKAAWLANTDISEKHDSLNVITDKALSEYIGKKEVIEKAKSLLEQKSKLDRLQVLQINKIL